MKMEGEVSLVAGRSQREKRRSYKDLLREEEIIDAEVRKTSKKWLKDTDAFYSGGELQKKKHYEDHFYRDHHSSSGSHQKKKQRSLLTLPDPAASSQTAVTAMGLLQAITSPTAETPPPSQERRTDSRDASSSSSSSCRRRPQVVREGLPVVGEEVELEGHYSGCHDVADSSGSSSGDDSECEKLTVHGSSSHSSSRRKKKSKKSKKKKERDRSREKKHSSKAAKRTPAANGSTEWSACTTVHHSREEKRRKRAEGGKRKSKDKKKKVLTAYQIFYKEYRSSILEEEPGLDFGDLSKRLADAWKQLPEGDKEVWRERSEYLQRKQMKSESGKHVKHVKQQHASRALKNGSRVKGHHSGAAVAPAGGAVVLKRQEAAVAPAQNGSAPRPANTAAFSPLRDPDVDPIDAAAHLQLLGESLSLIGRRLQETEGMVTVSGSLSVLLDSVLCALGPLACLTSQVPELNGCPHHVLSNTLDNIAYVMPGL
ncbi:HMG box-containing protein 4 isoform X1 [Sinocyclocheilus rhinocerous]|uniref:HMG box-containing protein 4 isoform X1 n=2 Tax=Sinocyclocheilus rhinocerous TaxID=307959 RepID=UPI0007B95B2B|nr:PREDICTED: HMG box-containing protein 4-like isoform X1 [Sinocyclocheilus rhinocerous]